MKLLIGLGNPTKNYKNNRHNVGHHFVDYAITQLTDSELTNSSNNPQCVNALINNKEILLCKSDTYMNLSGEFVNKMLKKHQNIDMDDLYIVHDDLDIPLGKYKIEKGRGPQLHNGIKSIEETIKSKDFWRIRIGVDNPSTRFARSEQVRIDGESYVLSDFTQQEKTVIETVFIDIIKKLTG